ncbi:transcriptional regulator MalT [Vibrio panuliri]|uniref:HTH-type transcriptional regulator MalT n=1 Tax=Vibrio panuliri TaxID=1381081 RepID=A0A1Q9HQX6_9VIBR|nr:HTH-type transcriptional regulator MalT [Vibrio panuliri]OLQ93232.1 transcriptional regulator MalT [Vibrio panuliri]
MWIPSKLSRPSYMIELIHRNQVLQCLQQAEKKKLVLMRAPAGYGKTTAASQWLSSKQGVGWFNIDANDNDPYRFACYFVAALNEASNQACKSILKSVEQAQSLDVMVIVTEALKQISKYSKTCYLVMDDYHHIHDDKIHQAISYFIKLMPENITLIITSRSNPPLGIASLRVHGLVSEIDQSLLAFNMDETLAFLQQRLTTPPSLEQAQQLYEYVEGWPSALELITWQSHDQTLPPLDPSQVQVNQTHLWEYLVEEVFANVDSETQEFLLYCSILDKFNHTLAAMLTQRNDAQLVIENLQQFGVFIEPIRGQHNWFRFHSLFQAFLSDERKNRFIGLEAQLQQRAAQAWLAHANPEQALYHAEQTNDSNMTIEILQRSGWELFNRGSTERLKNALSSLNSTQIYQNATLCLLHAWLAQSQQRNEDVGLILLQADSLKTATTSSEKGEFNALKAQIAISNNQPQQALELAELALSQIDGQAFHSRIVATSVIGEVNHVLGYLDRALPLMQQTEKLARQYQVHHQALWAILQQSEVLFAKGYLQAAFDVQESGFQLIQDQQLEQNLLHEFLLRSRAQLLFSWNRLDDAEQCVKQALSVLHSQPDKLSLHSYALLARIALCRGDMDKAARYIAEVELRMSHEFYHLDGSAHADLAMLLFWQAKQDHDAIKLWLDNAQLINPASNHFSQLQGRNIARAQLALGLYPQASETIKTLDNVAVQHHLLADHSRNAIIDVLLSLATGHKAEARHELQQALSLASQTAIMGDFLYNIEELKPLLQHSGFQADLDELTCYRVNLLLKSVSAAQRSRSAHFDESLVAQIVHHPEVPELVRNSPLTQREWQVLGLIYSGLSNEQIAQQLDVAGTTIKTHIRNLYQKLNIANRKQAIETAERLIKLVGS